MAKEEVKKEQVTLHHITERLQPYFATIRQYCIDHQQTIAVAESVTSGFIQLLLSAATDARCFYQGGITAYNTAQKTRHLDIEPIQADVGIGITGYATPVPEQGIEDIYAYMAIVQNGKVLYKGKIKAAGEAMEAQLYYAERAIKTLATHLKPKK
jgi:nicotinamide-nucleotide amidase